jgi:hypothetical protein
VRFVPDPEQADAALVLQSVKVNGRSAWFSAYTDHLSIVRSDGTRNIPIREVARITNRIGMRTGRIGLVLVDGEQIVIRGVRARDVPIAYQILVRLASTAR